MAVEDYVDNEVPDNNLPPSEEEVNDSIEALFRSDPLEGLKRDAEPGTKDGDQEEDNDQDTLEAEGGETEGDDGTKKKTQTEQTEPNEQTELLRKIADQLAQPPAQAKPDPDAPDPFTLKFQDRWADDVIEAFESEDPGQRRKALDFMLQQTQTTTANAVMAKFKELLPSIVTMASENVASATSSQSAATRNREALITEHPEFDNPSLLQFASIVGRELYPNLTVTEMTSAHRARIAEEVKSRLGMADKKGKTSDKAPPKMMQQTRGGSQATPGRDKKRKPTPAEITFAEVFPNAAANRRKGRK